MYGEGNERELREEEEEGFGLPCGLSVGSSSTSVRRPLAIRAQAKPVKTTYKNCL
jgi:hypothetical protein